GCALTDRAAADNVDRAGHEASGHTRGDTCADQVPSDRVTNDEGAGRAWIRVGHRDVQKCDVPSDGVEEHAYPVRGLPDHRDVAADCVVLDRPRNWAPSAEEREIPVESNSVHQNGCSTDGRDVAVH